jgi:cytoskeletal protein RodZ
VAQARRKKKSAWKKRLVLFVFMPLFVWFLAFLFWFNWGHIEKFFAKDRRANPAKASRNLDQSEKPIKSDAADRAEKNQRTESSREARPKEKILDEERKNLEDILKKK